MIIELSPTLRLGVVTLFPPIRPGILLPGQMRPGSYRERRWGSMGMGEEQRRRERKDILEQVTPVRCIGPISGSTVLVYLPSACGAHLPVSLSLAMGGWLAFHSMSLHHSLKPFSNAAQRDKKQVYNILFSMFKDIQ